MTLDAETAAWSGVQGDVWELVAERATVGRTYDDAFLLVQMRNKTTGALIASSDAGEQVGDVVAINVDDTDFTDPDAYVFAFKITETDGIPVSTDYVIEAQCEVNGDMKTFFSHDWECRKQWAYPA